MSNKRKRTSSLFLIVLYGFATCIFMLDAIDEMGTFSYVITLLISIVIFVGMLMEIFRYLKDRNYLKK